MRQTMEIYGKTVLAAAVALLLLSLIFVLSIVRRDEVTGGSVVEIAGQAVGRALLGSDTAVDTAVVGARLKTALPQVKTADVRVDEVYSAEELFSMGEADAGASGFSGVSVCSVALEGADALRTGTAALSPEGLIFRVHGNYTVRYTVTEGGAKRTGVLFVRALRRKGDEFLT